MFSTFFFLFPPPSPPVSLALPFAASRLPVLFGIHKEFNRNKFLLIRGIKHWVDIILLLKPGVGSGEMERFVRDGGLWYMQIRERV